MIKKIYKIPVELHYYCDDCNVEVKPTGKVLTSNPLKYVYMCPKCNKEIYLDQVYPCIVYEDKTIVNDIFSSNINMFNKF